MKTISNEDYKNSKLVEWSVLSEEQKTQALKKCPKPKGDELWRIHNTTGELINYRIK